jgi:D-sedoheptulose 7-phosphate isomerase
MESDIKKSIANHLHAFSFVESLIPSITDSVSKIKATIFAGGKILIAGNGGSASDAQHFAAEFVGRYVKERESYPAISLATDSSALTAISNDYGYNEVFSRQLSGLGNQGDIFIGITTSGNSENIINAIKIAKSKGIFSISLTGKDGGAVKDISDLCINVPANETARIQEVHIFILHLFCELFEIDI